VSHITVVPAYGRDYKSQKAVQADWDDNKDFLCSGVFQYGYLNKLDKEKYAPDDTILVRYDNQRKVYEVK